MMHNEEIAKGKVSLDDMLAEAKREVSFRKAKYPTWIANGTLKEDWAQIHLKRMEAIVTLLEWMIPRRAAMIEANQVLAALELIIKRADAMPEKVPDALATAIEAAALFIRSPMPIEPKP